MNEEKYSDKYILHIFYLKENGSIYAHTINKGYAKKFIDQRNMDKFYHKKKKLMDYEYYKFRTEYGSMVLEEVPLNIDMENYIEVVLTNKEFNEASDFCDNLDTDIQTASYKLLKTNILSKEEKEIVLELTRTYDTVHESDGNVFNSSRINQFRVFCFLFYELLN